MGSDSADSSSTVDVAAQRYAARMVYLTEEDETSAFGNTMLEPMGRTLKPPSLFMCRRQARADSTLYTVRLFGLSNATESQPSRPIDGQCSIKPTQAKNEREVY